MSNQNENISPEENRNQEEKIQYLAQMVVRSAEDILATSEADIAQIGPEAEAFLADDRLSGKYRDSNGDTDADPFGISGAAASMLYVADAYSSQGDQRAHKHARLHPPSESKD